MYMCIYMYIYYIYIYTMYMCIPYTVLRRSLSEEEDVATYTALGALYFNTGKYHKAKLSFSGALALDPHNLETRCNYVRSLP